MTYMQLQRQLTNKNVKEVLEAAYYLTCQFCHNWTKAKKQSLLATIDAGGTLQAVTNNGRNLLSYCGVPQENWRGGAFNYSLTDTHLLVTVATEDDDNCWSSGVMVYKLGGGQ